MYLLTVCLLYIIHEVSLYRLLAYMPYRIKNGIFQVSLRDTQVFFDFETFVMGGNGLSVASVRF